MKPFKLLISLLIIVFAALDLQAKGGKNVRVGNGSDGLALSTESSQIPGLDTIEKILWAYDHGTMPDPQQLMGTPQTYWKGASVYYNFNSKTGTTEVSMPIELYLVLKVFNYGPLVEPKIGLMEFIYSPEEAITRVRPDLFAITINDSKNALIRNSLVSYRGYDRSLDDNRMMQPTEQSHYRMYNGMLIRINKPASTGKCDDNINPDLKNNVCSVAYYYVQKPF